MFPLGNGGQTVAYTQGTAGGLGHPCRHADTFLESDPNDTLVHLGIDGDRKFR